MNRPNPPFLLLSFLFLACGDSVASTSPGVPAGEPSPSVSPEPVADDPSPIQSSRVASPCPATRAWDRVVKTDENGGGLDYAALREDRGDLDRYLDSLRVADVEELNEDERLAFWSNAYNAVVVDFVLEKYPDFESVQNEPDFFKERTFPIGGVEMALDEIEAQAREIDPRAHFSVVCASTSCPDLRGEAYVADRIDDQLADQTRRFLSDPSKGLRYDPESNQLWLSSIFKWYAGDFTGGSTVVAFMARGGVLDWVTANAPVELAARLKKSRPRVRYMDYDWALNDRPEK